LSLGTGGEKARKNHDHIKGLPGLESVAKNQNMRQKKEISRCISGKGKFSQEGRWHKDRGGGQKGRRNGLPNQGEEYRVV